MKVKKADTEGFIYCARYKDSSYHLQNWKWCVAWRQLEGGKIKRKTRSYAEKTFGAEEAQKKAEAFAEHVKNKYGE